MSDNLLLMCGNTPVITFCKGKVFTVHNPQLVPIKLRGITSVSSEDTETFVDTMITNYLQMMDWLGSRTLSISRRNAKYLYNLLRTSQAQDNFSKAKIALMCRAVSATDNYWVKNESDRVAWDDVNIRKIPLNDIVTQVALHGTSLSLQGSLSTPEYSTHGAYAKGWRRHKDGILWLHKISESSNDLESKVEVAVSGLLDKTNVIHCHYEALEDNGRYVCACPNMATDDVSMVSGEEYVSYINRIGKNADAAVTRMGNNAMYQMWIVDYIISNPDRHGQNWGFYMHAATGEIVRFHPLFDHNNAFDSHLMHEADAEYIFNGKSMRDCAKFALSRCDFTFREKVTRKDFVTREHWESFQKKCSNIGLKYK